MPTPYEIGPERRRAYQVIVFLAAVASAFGFTGLAAHNPRAATEMKTADALIRLAPQPARRDVVIVAMDPASTQKYGPVKSWPRRLLADGLARIEAGKPKWVALDLALDGRTRTGDAALWRQIANHQNVLLGMAYDADRTGSYTANDVRALRRLQWFAIADNLTLSPQTQYFPYIQFEPPQSDFALSSQGVGVFTRETDPDGHLRDARLYYMSHVQDPPYAGTLPRDVAPPKLADGIPVALPNLALVTSLRTFVLEKDSVMVTSGQAVRLAGNLNPPVEIPVDEQGKMQIRFAQPGAFPQVSFADVAQGKVPAATFRDKIVLLGATDPNDPATERHLTAMGVWTPRVEVTANAVATVLNRSYYELVAAHKRHLLGTLLLTGVIGGLCLMFLSRARATVAFVLLALGYLALTWALFSFSHYLLPIWPGLLTLLVPYLFGLVLALGPFRPIPVAVSPTYVPPQETANSR